MAPPETDAPADAPLRIALVSTWQSLCGIATYTRDLAKALIALGHEVSILAEVGDLLDPSFDGIPYERCWHRGDPVSLRRVADYVALHPVDVLHVEHEFGLFSWTIDLAALLGEARSRGVRAGVTLHTVLPGDECRRLATAAGLGIAHSTRGLDLLGMPAGGARIAHVHHGTPEVDRVRRQVAREALGIDSETFVVATTGFVTPGKNLEHSGMAILRASPRLRNKVLWIVGGYAPDAGYGQEFATWIETRSNLRIRTRLLRNYQNAANLDRILSVADLALLNSRASPASISGQSHLAMAHGLPILAADVPLYDDVRGVGEIFDTDAAVLHERIVEVATTPALRRGMAQRATLFGRRTSWSRMAARHVELWRGVEEKMEMEFDDALDNGDANLQSAP